MEWLDVRIVVPGKSLTKECHIDPLNDDQQPLKKQSIIEVEVDVHLKSTSSGEIKLTETAATTIRLTDNATLSIDNHLKSSAVKTRKRKAILLPDDYHTESAVRKLDNGMLQVCELWP